MSDKDHSPHIEYRVIGEKPYEIDHAPGVDCYDTLQATIHTKPEADRLIAFLKGNGYKVKLMRVSHTSLIEDRFDHDPEPEPGESSPPPAP